MPRRAEGNGERKSRLGEPEPRPSAGARAAHGEGDAERALAGAERAASPKATRGRGEARRKVATQREQALKRFKEVEAMVRGLEPRIVEVFRRHSVDPVAAGSMLEEVVTLLLYRWGEVARPEAWLMEMLEHRARRERRN